MAEVKKIWKCKKCGRRVVKPLEPSRWYPNGNSCGCFASDEGCEWIYVGIKK